MIVQKILKFIGFSALTFFCILVLGIFEMKEWPIGASVSGIALGLLLPKVGCSFQDIRDTTAWKVSQRKLKRGGFINDDTIVRISFSYLYRIKIGDKYLLVKNARGTGKYQPVGGVYKLHDNEKIELKNRYQVKDDDKIPIDVSSEDDYRLRLENKYLRKFMKRFDKKAKRERIDDLSREFREELVATGIVNWEQITYRFCGRHITGLQYGNHFRVYEVLLADVVELLLTPEQKSDLKMLEQENSEQYYFATAEEIMSLGVNTQTGNLKEIIGDHAQKIIEENEGKLLKIPCVGNQYTVKLAYKN